MVVSCDFMYHILHEETTAASETHTQTHAPTHAHSLIRMLARTHVKVHRAPAKLLD